LECECPPLPDPTLEPRLNQIFVPLLSVVGDPSIRAELREIARARNREIVADRGMDVEAQVLEVIKDLAGQQSKLTVAEVTAAFIKRYGREYDTSDHKQVDRIPHPPQAEHQNA
jgi:hypothetical protein